MRSPANCQTWNSCTASTPSTCESSLRWMSSNCMCVGTVCSKISADSCTVERDNIYCVVAIVLFSKKFTFSKEIIARKTNTLVFISVL